MNPTHVKLAVAAAAVVAAALIWLAGADSAPEPIAPPTAGVPDGVALRQMAQEELARDAADGRRRLCEAAALSGALDRRLPEVPAPPAGIAPDVPADEWLCRRLIRKIETSSGIPDRAAAVTRLEAELREALDRPGGLRLPDPEAATVDDLLARVRDRLEEYHHGRRPANR